MREGPSPKKSSEDENHVKPLGSKVFISDKGPTWKSILFFSALSFCSQAQRHHRGGGVHRCGGLSLGVFGSPSPGSFRNDQVPLVLMLLSLSPGMQESTLHALRLPVTTSLP